MRVAMLAWFRLSRPIRRFDDPFPEGVEMRLFRASEAKFGQMPKGSVYA